MSTSRGGIRRVQQRAGVVGKFNGILSPENLAFVMRFKPTDMSDSTYCNSLVNRSIDQIRLLLESLERSTNRETH